MKTKMKALILALSAVLLVVATVFTTVAFLKDSSNVVKNTFTVGDVAIELDETDIVNGGRTKTGNQYHLMPGGVYTKDPTVTVLKNSEDCYVRMLVTVNNIFKLKAAFDTSYVVDGVFLLQNLVDWNTAWEFEACVEDTQKDTAVYEFRYNKLVEKNANANTQLPALFTTITLPGDLDNDAIAKLADVSIDVIAHAMQAQGFEGDMDKAWNNFG